MWVKLNQGCIKQFVSFKGWIKKQQWLTACLDISKRKNKLKNVNVDAFSEPGWECNTPESSDCT